MANETTVEISRKGEWIRVPALRVGASTIITNGRLVKIASVCDEEWAHAEITEPDDYVKKLKEHRSGFIRADLFTFAQKLPNVIPKFSYPKELESVAAIRITSFREWWERLPQVTRKNVRRAEKRGVITEVKDLDDKLIRDLVELSRDSPIRQGKRFVHFGKTFEQVKKDQSTLLGRCDFICSYSDGELIGMAKIIYGDRIASILQFLPKASQHDKRPANALIAKMVEICNSKGLEYLIYGMYNYGNKRNTSLLEFKIRNCFEEFLVPRYYIPLTVRGEIGFGMGLHRGLVGILPNNALGAANFVREKWYNLRSTLSRRSSMLEQPNRIRQTERSNPPAGSTPDLE
jgi:hypothetical protein